MCAPSYEFWRNLTNFGEPTTPYSQEPPWQSPEFRRRSPTSTRVQVKVPSVRGWPSECAQELTGVFREGGAGPGAVNNGGAGTSAGTSRLCSTGKQRQNSLPAPLPALPASTPNFASTCVSTPASVFLEFLVLGPSYQVAGIAILSFNYQGSRGSPKTGHLKCLPSKIAYKYPKLPKITRNCLKMAGIASNHLKRAQADCLKLPEKAKDQMEFVKWDCPQSEHEVTNFFASCEVLCVECGEVSVTNFKPLIRHFATKYPPHSSLQYFQISSLPTSGSALAQSLGMYVIFTEAGFKFWGICLVNISVRMVLQVIVSQQSFNSQNSLDRVQSRKSDLVILRGLDWRELSELCVLLFFPGKTLIFFVFLENGKENHQKSKDFVSLPNP